MITGLVVLRMTYFNNTVILRGNFRNIILKPYRLFLVSPITGLNLYELLFEEV
jgi:hypothetical protein